MAKGMPELVKGQLKKYDITYVDVKICYGLHNPEEVLEHTPDIFSCLGRIVAESNLVYYVAEETNQRGQHRNITIVPKGSIISIVEQDDKVSHGKV